MLLFFVCGNITRRIGNINHILYTCKKLGLPLP